MKWTVTLASVTVWAAMAWGQAADQPAKPAQQRPARVLGEVTAIDAGSQKISVKSDSGSIYTLNVDGGTSYQRVPPDARDLKNATPIKFSDLANGDRVIARGQVDEANKAVAATSVIVMTRTDLAKKQEKDRAEWIRRGVVGTVEMVDKDAKTLMVKQRGRGDATGQIVVLDLSANPRFRRYAADSVKFADAKPSSLDEIKVGDQVRALGDKDAEGHRVKVEELVSGSFRNIAAQVKSVNAATGEIVVTDLDLKKPVTIKVNPDTMMRRLPEQLAQMMAMRANATISGAAPGGAPGQGMRPGGGAAGGSGMRPAGEGGAAPGGPVQGTGGGQGGPGRMGGFGGGGFAGGGGMRGGDISQMLERMPALQLAELKAGDALIISSTSAADPARATAITLVAGVEPLLTAPRTANQSLAGTWNFGDMLPMQ